MLHWDDYEIGGILFPASSTPVTDVCESHRELAGGPLLAGYLKAPPL